MDFFGWINYLDEILEKLNEIFQNMQFEFLYQYTDPPPRPPLWVRICDRKSQENTFLGDDFLKKKIPRNTPFPYYENDCEKIKKFQRII